MQMGGQDEEMIWQGRPSWRAWAGLVILGVVTLPVVVGLVILVVVFVRTRSRAWRLTTRRIESELGWLSRRVDNLELWRVRDVELVQGIFDRMFGVSTLMVTAHDDHALLELNGLPGGRAIYDRLMAAVMASRQQRGVLNLNP